MKRTIITLLALGLGLLCSSLRAEQKSGDLKIEYSGTAKLQFTLARKEMTDQYGWRAVVKVRNSEDHDIIGIAYKLELFEGSRRIWTTMGFAFGRPPIARKDQEGEFELCKGLASSIDRIVISEVRFYD